MDYHHHARLTVHGREGLAKSVVEGRLSLREAAAERGLSRQTAGGWPDHDPKHRGAPFMTVPSS
jgi:leucine-zipper of insertion element IS481